MGADESRASGVPAVSSTDSFFIVLSTSGQKRDMPPLSQLISPPFVLAPRGVDLALKASLNNVSEELTQQGERQLLSPPSAQRPTAWAYLAIPLAFVLLAAIAGSVVYAHRRGRRSARKAALLASKDGEEKWREATRKEVEQLTESTTSASRPTPLHACHLTARSDSLGQHPSVRPGFNFAGAPPSPLHHTCTILSSTSSSVLASPSPSPSSLLSSASGRTAWPLRQHVLPYNAGGGTASWGSTVSAGESSVPLLAGEQPPFSPPPPALPALPPVSLRPGSSKMAGGGAMVNPYEALEAMPFSLETIGAAQPRPLPHSTASILYPHSRALSSSAAERSTRNGRYSF